MCRNIKTLFNFEPPGDRGRNPRLRAAIRAQAVRLQQAVAGQRRGVRPRRRRSLRQRAAAADLAAYPCAGARPRDRGREGEGAVAGAVRLGGTRMYRSDVRRSHKRPRAAALLPPFRQTRIASSLKNLEEPSVEVPMLYSQSPPLTAEETSFGGLARDPDVRSDQRTGRRRMKPSIDSPHPYRFGEGQLASDRPSIGRRMFRTPYPVLYCGSHRCRRHAWLAVLR